MKGNKEYILDKLVVIVPTVIFIISTYLLLDDRLLFNVGTRSLVDRVVVARLSMAGRDVRRKIQNEFVFQPIKKDAVIYEDDSIFTGNDSTAIVTYLDETSITISPDSLVTISAKQVKIQSGTFVTKLGSRSALTVVINGKKKKISGKKDSNIRINVSKSGKSSLVVLEGNVIVEGNSGNKQKIEKNQELSVGVSGQLGRVEKLDIDLLYPKANELIKRDNDGSYTFEWESRKKGTKYQFQMARDARFSKFILRKTIKNDSIRLKKLPSVRSFYWRVFLLDDKSKNIGKSSSQIVLVKSVDSPILVLPELDRVLLSSLKNVSFSWESQFKGQSYEIQISDSELFINILKQVKIAEASYEYRNPGKGSYFWRVRSLSENEPLSLWSTPSKFLVDLPLNLVSLKLPMNKKIINAVYQKQIVNFSWDKLDGKDIRYIFKVFNKGDLKKPIDVKNTTKTKYKVSLKVNQNYVWQVTALKRGGAIKSPTESRSFEIKYIDRLKPPSEMKTETMYAADGLTTIFKNTWKAVEGAQTYQLDIYNDENTRVLRKKLSGEITELEYRTSKAENFKWRIYTFDKYNRRSQGTDWAEMKIPTDMYDFIDDELKQKETKKIDAKKNRIAEEKRIVDEEKNRVKKSVQLAKQLKLEEIAKNQEIKKANTEAKKKLRHWSLPED